MLVRLSPVDIVRLYPVAGGIPWQGKGKTRGSNRDPCLPSREHLPLSHACRYFLLCSCACLGGQTISDGCRIPIRLSPLDLVQLDPLDLVRLDPVDLVQLDPLDGIQ